MNIASSAQGRIQTMWKFTRSVNCLIYIKSGKMTRKSGKNREN